MKIENVNNNMNPLTIDHPNSKKRIMPAEESDKISISIKQEKNEVLKVESPPYFPIGDTQAIYRKR